MIQRKDVQLAHINDLRLAGIERPMAPCKFAPRDAPETGDYAWTHQRHLELEMGSACSDFIGVRIAITPLRILRITPHQIGDEDAFDSCLLNHRVQQVARPITAERNACAIAAETSRRQTNKSNVGRDRTVARNHL